MDYVHKNLQICIQIIGQNLNWGPSELWKTKDFENLNSMILQKTGISLSVSTLRRIWGHADYLNKPTLTTLDALAVFAGYENWRSFEASINPNNEIDNNLKNDKLLVRNSATYKKQSIILVFVLVVILSLSAAFYYNYQDKNKVNADNYVFKVERLTENLPNTVVFKYEVIGSDNDSVYFQQSWDNQKRVLIDKNSKTLSSIYYQPGGHMAKLMVGDQIVRQEVVIIPTKGWVSMIENPKTPIYLEQKDFFRDSLISIGESTIDSYGIDMKTAPKLTQIYNVGNFNPIEFQDLHFSTDIKHDYGQGASSCQYSYVMLYSEEGQVMIPLSQKGCVANLNATFLDEIIRGTDHDLSGFGTDVSKWTNVEAIAKDNNLTILINQKLAYSFKLTNLTSKVVGLGVFFAGTGSIKNVKFTDRGKVVFDEV